MNMITDMTEGKPLLMMVRFSLPILLANVLQLFYTIADSAVVGRMLGVTSFAAVGSTVAIYWLVLSIVLSMGHGFGIIFAQRYGAKDFRGLRRAFTTALYLAAITSMVVGCAGITMSRYVLARLETPLELVYEATVYLGWLTGGIIIAFTYNVLSAMLRALGDSKTPMMAVIITSFLNIALDIALAPLFGVAGIAAATLFSQLTACVYCVFVLRRTTVFTGEASSEASGETSGETSSDASSEKLGSDEAFGEPDSRKFNWAWDKTYAIELLRLGLPLGFRNGVIEIGGIVVQRYVNRYGMEFVAGIAAAKRMYSLLLVAGGAFEDAIGTFTAQNFGAGKLDRVRSGVVAGRWLMLISAVVIMAAVIPLRRFILGLLLEGEVSQIEAVLDAGALQLAIMALGLPILNMLFLYRSALDGIGRPSFSVMSGFMELAMRIVAVAIFAPAFGGIGIMLADPVGWVAAYALLMVAYHTIIRHKTSPRSHTF